MRILARVSTGVATATSLLLAASLAVAHLATADPSAAPDPTSAPVEAVAPSPAVLDRCDRPAPTSARGWAAAFARVEGGWRAADNAASVRLADGRLVWLFGDTLEDFGSGPTMVHNSMVIADGGCLRSVSRDAVLPDPGADRWYWPTHGVADATRLLVFAGLVRRDGTSFEGGGTRVFEFDVSGRDPRLVRSYATPSSGRPETSTQFGSAVARHGRELYVYGTRRVDRPLVFGRDVYLAKVPLADLTNWTFWDGSGWSAYAADAAPVRRAEEGVPAAFTATVARDGATTLVYKRGGYLGSAVVRSSAPSPLGPFTDDVVASSPSDAGTGVLTYLAYGHPEIHLASGRSLLTVSRNNSDPSRVLADPERYVPRFLEIPAG